MNKILLPILCLVGSLFTSCDHENASNSIILNQDDNILVAYFSASGNTKKVAEYIAEATKGGLFEIEPSNPYTSDDLDWRNPDSRVSREHNNENLQNTVSLQTYTPENWENYDVVFIGYPIWWGIAAWPVNRFVTENNFNGKTVIPFCTSSSSGLGESGTLLSQKTNTGDWKSGERFSSGVSKETINNWIVSLGL